MQRRATVAQRLSDQHGGIDYGHIDLDNDPRLQPEQQLPSQLPQRWDNGQEMACRRLYASILLRGLADAGLIAGAGYRITPQERDATRRWFAEPTLDVTVNLTSTLEALGLPALNLDQLSLLRNMPARRWLRSLPRRRRDR